MKKLKRFPILVATILVTISASFAATDTSDININVTYTPYVNLIGTVVGAQRVFTAAAIKPRGNRRKGPLMTLGTLGLESNTSGNCNLAFSTLNNFKLRHTVSNKKLTKYILRYSGKRINKNKREMTVPCNKSLKPLKFRTVGKFRKKVKSGIYRDVVTITVTTE